MLRRCVKMDVDSQGMPSRRVIDVTTNSDKVKYFVDFLKGMKITALNGYCIVGFDNFSQ